MFTRDITICPVCGSRHLHKLSDCADHYATNEIFEIHTCDDCHFCFTQHFPDEKEIGRYYDTTDYISHSDTKKGIINTIYHAVRNFMLQRKAELVEKKSGITHGKILDIGSGTGYFLHVMAQKGWNVEGIEKNSGAASFAKNHFGLKIDAPTQPFTLPENKYDVITLWHVLEHLQALNETGLQMNRALKEDGTLIIAIPNCESYDACYYKEFWAAWDVPRHLWHFSPHTFAIWADKQGFEIESATGMPFDGFYVSMLSEKYKGKKPAFFKGFLRGTLAWLSAKDKYDRSSSVIYVLKKKKQ